MRYSTIAPELLGRRGHWMAAVLACGPDAVLSHRDAAALHGLLETARRNIEVTIARRCGRRRPGIDIRTSTTLAPEDIELVDGVPCTTVARTLLDVAGAVPRRRVERAFDQAEVSHVLNLLAVHEQLERNPNHRGRRAVEAVLAEHYLGSTPTASELEEAFLTLCRRVGVHDPEVNAWVELGDGEPAILADFVWREERVIVETDGRRFHDTRQARERDARRGQRALLAAWRVMRAPWRLLVSRPQEL